MVALWFEWHRWFSKVSPYVKPSTAHRNLSNLVVYALVPWAAVPRHAVGPGIAQGGTIAMIVCVAMIGKKNELLFLETFVPEREQLRFHYIVHSSLDVFEERRLRRPAPQSSSSQDMYLGHLCPIEEFRLYGYQTSTHIKIVAVLTEGEQARDADLRAVFLGLHQLYINYVQSPFSSLAGRITSDRFHHGVERQVNLYNGVS